MFPVIIIILAGLECILAFQGPMALLEKPSLVVATPFSYGLEPDEVDALFVHLQRAMARTRLFRVIPHRFIEAYYLEQKDRPDMDLERKMSYTDYEEMARELKIDRLLTGSVYPKGDAIDVSLALRSTENGQILHRVSYSSPDVLKFIAGKQIDGDDLDLAADFRLKTKGVTLFDNLFFLLLAGQVILAVSIGLRKKPDLLNQVLIVGSLLVFLFAFIYAKNASMDYVQRFIANKGQISLAENTLTEQLYSFVRFGPLLLLNIGYYAYLRIKRRGRQTAPVQADRNPPGREPRGRDPYGMDRSDKEQISREGIGTGAVLPDGPGSLSAANISRTWALPLTMLSALMYALSFPSFLTLAGTPFLAWVCLIPLFLAILYSDTLRAIIYGVAFGALYTLVLNYWHGTYSYISLAFSVLLSTMLYVIWMVPFVIIVKKSQKWGFIIIPLFWLTFDYLRTLGFLGYPWGFLGVSNWSFLPLIQIADFTGVWGLTFLIVFWNAAVTWSFASGDFGWSWSRRRWVPIAAAGILVMLSLGYGIVHLLRGPPEDARVMRVVLVQQNRDPRKHQFQDSYRSIVRLTNDAMRESGGRKPDLIVWPEGGFMTDIRYWTERSASGSSSSGQVERFLQYQKRLGTWLVTGTQDHIYETGPDGERKKRNFNSSVLLTDRGEIAGFYHKIHLVPFTEHFPYRDQFPWLAALLDKFGTSNWKQGSERTIYEHPSARFFTPICFEDIFPDDLRHFVRNGAQLIVNMSNDYWSLTPVEGKQHAIHSIFRAVENRRPMVRATASGLTIYISVDGRVSRDFPAYYTRGYLIADIPIADRGTSFYTRHGDWLPQLCLILTLAAALFLTGRGARRLYLSGGLRTGASASSSPIPRP